MCPKPLPRRCGAALHFDLGLYRSFGQHTEIILQCDSNLDHHLRLFVGNEKSKLHTKDNRAWTPLAQRPYVPCFLTTHIPSSLCVCRDISPTSEMRVEIEIKRHGPLWLKKEQTGKVIVDIQKLFNDYSSSNNHELTASGQS